MTQEIITIAYHSGYGHTAKVAKAIAEGSGESTKLLNVEKVTEEDWKTLDDSHAIIFGSPTYMGGVSAVMKKFMEDASSRWVKHVWKDKIAAGFVNSGGLSGDKLNTMFQLYVNAMQHGMIWVGFTELGPNKKGTDIPQANEINRLSSYTGLMTQANNDSADITPPEGDLKSAKLFGQRIMEITRRFKNN